MISLITFISYNQYNFGKYYTFNKKLIEYINIKSNENSELKMICVNYTSSYTSKHLYFKYVKIWNKYWNDMDMVAFRNGIFVPWINFELLKHEVDIMTEKLKKLPTIKDTLKMEENQNVKKIAPDNFVTYVCK